MDLYVCVQPDPDLTDSKQAMNFDSHAELLRLADNDDLPKLPVNMCHCRVRTGCTMCMDVLYRTMMFCSRTPHTLAISRPLLEVVSHPERP